MKYQRALELAESPINPAWYFVKEIPRDTLLGDLYGSTGMFTPSMMSYGGDVKFYRSYVTGRWCWAIPSPDAIARILKVLDGRPVVEIGAGNGYWAWLLSQAGIQVHAYDVAPVHHEKSWFQHHDHNDHVGHISGFEDFEHEEFFPVRQGGAEKVAEHPGSVLFLCWPTMSEFAAESVKAFQGDTVVYIGEGQSGCNADSEFFWLMEGDCGCWDDDKCDHDNDREANWKAEYHRIVQWGGLHDNLVIYTKETP